MGVNPFQAVTIIFPYRGKTSSRGSRGRFRPHTRVHQWEVSVLSEETGKQMLKQRVTHSYQWLRSTIHHQSKITQSSPDSLGIQGPSKI